MRLDIELDDELITVEVVSYRPGTPMVQNGMGMGDCIAPEDAEVEIHVVGDDVADRLTDSDWGVLEDEVLAVLTMMRQEQED